MIDGKSALHRIVALNLRASVFAMQGEVQKEIDDYSAVVALGGAPAEQVAKALYGLGAIYFQMRKMDLAAQNFEQILGMSDAPPATGWSARRRLPAHTAENREQEGFLVVAASSAQRTSVYFPCWWKSAC